MREAADLRNKLMAVAAENRCFKACFPLPSCHLPWLGRVKGELADCSLYEAEPRSARGQRTDKGRTKDGQTPGLAAPPAVAARGRRALRAPGPARSRPGAFPARLCRGAAARSRRAGEGQVQGGRTSASGHVVPA